MTNAGAFPPCTGVFDRAFWGLFPLFGDLDFPRLLKCIMFSPVVLDLAKLLLVGAVLTRLRPFPLPLLVPAVEVCDLNVKIFAM